MLVLHPRRVEFAGTVWEGVVSIAVDRVAERVLVDHGDDGPHAVFADVPEQRVTVRVVMDVAGGSLDAPAPGATGALVFRVAGTGAGVGAGAGRMKVSMQAVVTGVAHEVSLRRGAVRTVDLVAVSATGGTDPVTLSEDGGEL